MHYYILSALTTQSNSSLLVLIILNETQNARCGILTLNIRAIALFSTDRGTIHIHMVLYTYCGENIDSS